MTFIGFNRNQRVYLSKSHSDAISFGILMKGEVKRTEHGNFLIFI